MPLAPSFAVSAGLPWMSCDSIKPKGGQGAGTDFGLILGQFGALGKAAFLAFKMLKCSVDQQTPS